VPGLGDRPGHGGPHRLAPRGAGLGRGRARERRDLLLHPGARRSRVSERTILLVEGNADDVELTLRPRRQHDLRWPRAGAADGGEALEYMRVPHAFAALVHMRLRALSRTGIADLAGSRKDPRQELVRVVVVD